MKQFTSILFAVLFFFTANAQTIKQDDSFRTGRLKNGLTYYIRHNAKDPGLADFYIAQRVGSILEEPRQRGLAHFLEHMAFNGTKNFPGDGKRLGIVPWCETIGVKFGTNLNAYTSVEQTVYNIKSVPVKREAIVDSVLLILHDWSHYLLLTDEEIDKERGVIHEEWRTRRAGMASQRMIERVMPKIYKGTKYEDCLPIGNMDIVDNFPYNDLRDYYHKWYRPDLQAIIVVGDIDVNAVEKKIKKSFSKIPMPENAAERVYYPVNDNDKMIVAVDKDSEQPIILSTLYMKRETTPDTDKNQVKYLRDDYVEGLITSMLNGRYQELQHQETPPCLSATAHNGSFFVSRTKDAFSIGFGCRQENIKGSFDAAIGIAEQARRFGFTQSELDRAKALSMAGAERIYKERNDRRNSYYIRKALRNFTDWEPMTTAEDDLAYEKQFQSEVTLDEINKVVKEMITDRNQVLTVFAPDKEGLEIPSEDILEQWVLEAQAKDYTPWQEAEVRKNLISELPTPGSIVSIKAPENGSESVSNNFGYTEMTLSNGVKVYVKPTNFTQDQIQMRFYKTGGTQYFPDEDVPNFSFISSAITKAGVGDFDAIELRKALTGKIVRLNPSVGDETQSINGSASVKDLKTMMELTYLYFTSPRKDSVAFNGEINRMRSFLTNREANPQVSYNDSLIKILYNDNPRVQPTKKETLEKVNYDRILEIYRECFSNADGWTMIITGHVDIDSLKPLLCQYIASLPSSKTTVKGEVHPYPDIIGGEQTHKFSKKMNTPSALVNIYYTFAEPFTPKTDLTLEMLTRVLKIAYTDSVREEKGGTYGVSVSYSLNRTSNPDVLIKINFRTDPARYDELIPIVYQQIQNIADNGPLESSMDKVRKFLHKNYEQNITYDDYWQHIMYQYLRNGIDYHTGFNEVLDAVTSDDVKQMAKDLLDAKRRIEVTMLSE